MNFAIERPSAVYGLILLIPALFISLKRYRSLLVLLKVRNGFMNNNHTFLRMKRCFLMRTVFRSLAWISFVAAFAGISWGVNTVPVQKTGKSVAMVFDISYSMLAKDGPGYITRLEAACSYSSELLDKIPGTSVSVSLAKGDGLLSLPMTEDFNAVKTLLSELSPALLTSQGSSLGGGIRAALTSFPQQSSNAGIIWLFTDGEETDSELLSALQEAVRRGYPVAIIGFGSERETEITAGDGKTKIKTALRSSDIENLITLLSAQSSNGREALALTPVFYTDASETGSANGLLNMLSRSAGSTEISYEVHLIERHNIFITLAIIFFFFSFIAGEIDFNSGIKNSLKHRMHLL